MPCEKSFICAPHRDVGADVVRGPGVEDELADAEDEEAQDDASP